jgi:hypothetical protein
VKTELLKDVASMSFNRKWAQVESPGDLLVAPPLSDQLQDLAFARRQKIITILDFFVPD